MRFVIVTGVSGAGKTSALQMLHWESMQEAGVLWMSWRLYWTE